MCARYLLRTKSPRLHCCRLSEFSAAIVPDPGAPLGTRPTERVRDSCGSAESVTTRETGLKMLRAGTRLQCSGRSPIHGTPESTNGTVRSRPFVTTRFTISRACSSRSDMRRVLAAIALPMRVFAWARYFAIAACSSARGSETSMFRMREMSRSHCPIRTPSDAAPNFAT